jgi:hypothetical protein
MCIEKKRSANRVNNGWRKIKAQFLILGFSHGGTFRYSNGRKFECRGEKFGIYI